jgi:hypothetical protein
MTGMDRLHTAKLSLLIAATAAVCFGQHLPGPLPSDAPEFAAKVIQLTGQVSVLKNDVPWVLDVGDQIQAKQLIITGPDGQAKFQVSDGSTFDVYPNSRVVFRKNAPNWKDLLDVLVGRVKVQIEHLYGPNPNRVITPTAVISVRGTIFDISVGDDDETTEVAVEEGSVEVQHALLPRGNPKIVNAGDPPLIIYRNVPLASSRFDKGDMAKRGLRMIVDAISTWESRLPKNAGGGGDSSSGDTSKKLPPPTSPGTLGPLAVPGHFTSSNGDFVTVLVVKQPHGKLYKAAHFVMEAAVRFVLGDPPGLDVMRAIQ